MGVSKNCYTDYGIPSCLVYGNPNNSMNELKIQHLFGTSFEKDASICSNLTQGEISMTLNTTTLSDDFIITHDSSHDIFKEEQNADHDKKRT